MSSHKSIKETKKRIESKFGVILCFLGICLSIVSTCIEISGEEIGNIDSISENTVEIDITSEMISAETESNSTEEQEGINTLGIFYLVPGVAESEIKNTVFYIDGIPYEVTGNEIVIRVNSADTSIHTVYAVADGYAQSGTKTFSFIGMQSSVMALFAYSEDGANISYVTGVLKAIDFLSFGKIHMEDGSSYDYDPDLITDERGLRGKTILCTLKDGIVIDFKEYTATNSETTEIEANNYSKVYGKEKKPLTNQGKVLKAANEYNSAMINYYNSLGQTAQKKLKQTNSTSQDKGKQLRAIDEAKGSDRMLTIDANMPDKAIDSAYAALSDFLDEYKATGVELGKINLSEEKVEIEARIVNQIINNIGCNGLPRRKYGNYYVEISALSIWGNYTGTVIVQGKGKTYYNVINSSTKEVAQTMEDYLNELADMTKDLDKQALQSIVNEFIDTTYIGDITKAQIKKLFKDQAAHISKYGFGKEIIDISNNLLEDYKQAKSILELRNIDGFDDAMVNARTIHKNLKLQDYTFEMGSGDDCPIVREAVSRVDKARNNFISALSDYLYSTDSYTEQNNSSTWNKFVKIFINCPVDFSIYDKSGNRIAYYEDDKVSADTSSVKIELIGDRKIIYVNSEMAYIGNIKLTATDDGAMDYIVERYVDGAAVERANYYNISLEGGNTFTQNANWDDLSTFTTQNPLIANSGVEIMADEYLAVTDDAVINVVSSASAGGKVIGEGAYVKGDTASLSAIPEEGYRFDGWYIDGELQDGNTTYHFTAEKNVTVRAEFVATDIVHPDYKAVVAREYRDFAGVFVYKNKSVSGNIDILLRLEGETYSSAFDSFKVKGYLDDNLVIEKSFTADATSQSNMRLENIDLKGSEHVEIYDGNDVPIAYVVYVPDYRNLDDLVINADTVLEEDTYCNDLTVNSDLDLNGHDLIVVGEVSESGMINVTNGVLRILSAHSAAINLQQGSAAIYSDFDLAGISSLNLSHDKDEIIFYGDCYCSADVSAGAKGTVSAGVITFVGNVLFYDELTICGTNKAIFAGVNQQIVKGTFNDVKFENDDIRPTQLKTNRLLSDVNVNAKENGSVYIGLSIKDSNGYNINIEGNANGKLDISGGRCNINGDAEIDISLDNNGIINIAGSCNSGSISLNNGECHVLGDLSVSCLTMDHESDLLDIEGDLRLIECDSEIENGTIKLYGDINLENSFLLCKGDNKFVFDGNSQQNINGFKVYETGSGEVYFNDVACENKNRIVVTDVMGFGFVNLLSDLELEIEDNYYFTILSYAYSYSNETKITEANLHGHNLIVNTQKVDKVDITGKFKLSGGELIIDGGAEICDATIDIDGGKLEIDGCLELGGSSIIDINKGKLLVTEDLYLGGWPSQSDRKTDSIIIMNNSEDMIEVFGDIDCCTQGKAFYKGKTYCMNPQLENEYSAISAGTIKLYGDLHIGEKISFAGTNLVVLCGNEKQYLEAYNIEHGVSFNQSQLINQNIVLDGMGLGKLVSDAKIVYGDFAGETYINGNTLYVEQEVTNAGKIYVDNGELNVNSDLINWGDINVNNGKINVFGNMYNTKKLNISDNSIVYVKGDYESEAGSTILESSNDLLDVDGTFSARWNNLDFQNGIVTISGGVWFGSTQEIEGIIHSKVILDGISKQSVDMEVYDEQRIKYRSKFDTLQIMQPISNYEFDYTPCWNTLLDANGNVISGQQSNGSDNNQSTNGTDNNQSTAKPDDSNKPESSSKMEVGTKVSVGKVQYKVIQSRENELSVAYEKCEDKKAASVSIPNTVVINGVTYKVTSIEKNAFKNNKNLKKVIVGKNIENIKEGAFYGCTKLSKVTMGSNVLAIDNKAFYKCSSLTKITILAKVGKIGKQAFYGCKNLKSITVKTTKLTNKNVGSKAFQGIHKKATIKVPKKKLSAYKKLFKKKGLSSKVKVTD